MPNVVSQFTSSIRTGVAPLTVNFTNTTTGPYISVRWDFGDGAQSSLINPSHQFLTDGVFQVTLTAYDEFSGQSVSNTSITIFADDDYSTSSSTQQALFTNKRFTPGQVAVRKTLVDGSNVETEFPLSSATGDFNLELDGIMIPIEIWPDDTLLLNHSYPVTANGTRIYNNYLADYTTYITMFMNSGGTDVSTADIGKQHFTYKMLDVDVGQNWDSDRLMVNIYSGSGLSDSVFQCITYTSITGGTTGTTFDNNPTYKAVQTSPTIDGLETLNIPNMYQPDTTASGILKYFEVDEANGSTKLYIHPSYSGWNTVERWKAGSVRFSLPYLLWHTKSTGGIQLVDSTTTYRDELTNLEYGYLRIEDIGTNVGRVFYEKKMIVIDDVEVQAALQYTSNRSYTLPDPLVTSTSTSDGANGGLDTGTTYFITYGVHDTPGVNYTGGTEFGTGDISTLHCRYIRELTPTVSGNKFRIQAPSSVWHTTNRSTSNDTGFTATKFDVYVGSATTGDIKDASWSYETGLTYSTLATGVEMSYNRLLTLTAATFANFTFSGTSDLKFGEDPTILGYFSATAQSTIYKMSTTCVAKNNEFNTTQNDTFDESLNESVYITEVALYNENNELLMTGKLNTPVEKNDKKFVTIKMELDL